MTSGDPNALFKCCPHTQPLCHPCAECTENILRRVRASGAQEAVSESKNQVSEFAKRADDAVTTASKLEKLADELRKRIERANGFVDSAMTQLKEKDRQIQNLEAQLAAEAGARYVRRHPFKEAVE